jgi:hypothetical protein
LRACSLGPVFADPVALSPKGAQSPTHRARGATPLTGVVPSVVTAYTERVQELTTIGSRVALEGLLLPAEVRSAALSPPTPQRGRPTPKLPLPPSHRFNGWPDQEV